MKEVTFIIQSRTVNGEFELFQWFPGKIIKELDAAPEKLIALISGGLLEWSEKLERGQQIVVNIQLK